MTAAEDAKKKAEAEASKIVKDAETKAEKIVKDAEAKAEKIIDDANEEAAKSKAEDGDKEEMEDRSYNDHFNDLYAAVSRQVPDSVDKEMTLRSIAGLQAETRSIHTKA
ncbi:hypothetical protein SEA_JORDANFARM_53 [Microbacterium phage JordanFarm]